jgi:ABC-2 type transport system ATP-binding protein
MTLMGVMTDDFALRMTGVSKRYGHIEALRETDFSLENGEILGILGPNGAGKSTLLKLAAGLLTPTTGRIELLGGLSDEAGMRRALGYMPQSLALYEDLSARENLRLFGSAHDVDRLEARITKSLAWDELRGREDDPIFTYSGGMKQIASLACTLLHEPRLLLLDEPTAGLDLEVRKTFWRKFRDLAGSGATVLVTTHQIDDIWHCDRLIVLTRGRIVARVTPEDLGRMGETTVRITRDQQVTTERLSNYADGLPRLLRTYGLDPRLTRIEIERPPFDEVLMEMIHADGSGEGGDASDP